MTGTRLKAGFQPRLASRCWFAVHRPGSPVAERYPAGVTRRP